MRSIPACAGEPGVDGRRGMKTRVYPRVCGGADRTGLSLFMPLGLSPRVRGSPPTSARVRGPTRSIPACAGEPRLLNGGGNGHGVYPRVCGGAHKGTVLDNDNIGLSPRVRGSLDPSDTRSGGTGSIPACAGEPRVWPASFVTVTVYPRVCGGATQLHRRFG